MSSGFSHRYEILGMHTGNVFSRLLPGRESNVLCGPHLLLSFFACFVPFFLFSILSSLFNHCCLHFDFIRSLSPTNTVSLRMRSPPMTRDVEGLHCRQMCKYSKGSEVKNYLVFHEVSIFGIKQTF